MTHSNSRLFACTFDDQILGMKIFRRKLAIGGPESHESHRTTQLGFIRKERRRNRGKSLAGRKNDTRKSAGRSSRRIRPAGKIRICFFGEQKFALQFDHQIVGRNSERFENFVGFLESLHRLDFLVFRKFGAFLQFEIFRGKLCD